jgi:hypothetical protein
VHACFDDSKFSFGHTGVASRRVDSIHTVQGNAVSVSHHVQQIKKNKNNLAQLG